MCQVVIQGRFLAITYIVKISALILLFAFEYKYTDQRFYFLMRFDDHVVPAFCNSLTCANHSGNDNNKDVKFKCVQL